MKLRSHVIASTIFSILLFVVFKSWKVSLSSFLSGVLIDCDHVLDYYCGLKQRFRLKELFNACHYKELLLRILILHSWELLFLLYIYVFFTGSNLWIVGIVIGFTQHVVLDQIFNSPGRLTYFFLWRLKNGFNTKRMFPNPYRHISVTQIELMSDFSIREKDKYCFYGHSTVNHNYEKKSISVDSVVIDNATGLMWYQYSSIACKRYDKAMRWVRKLNRKGYAGYYDWRLPTVEEAASLLEQNRRNGQYIAPVFSGKQQRIVTGNTNGFEGAWSVNYSLGSVCLEPYTSDVNYVRPVRSIK